MVNLIDSNVGNTQSNFVCVNILGFSGVSEFLKKNNGISMYSNAILMFSLVVGLISVTLL